MYLKSGSWPEISDIEFILHSGCHAMVSTAGQSRAHNVKKDREVLSKRAMEMKYSWNKTLFKYRICQHCEAKTSTMTPTFYYIFIIFLTWNISVLSFIYNLLGSY